MAAVTDRPTLAQGVQDQYAEGFEIKIKDGMTCIHVRGCAMCVGPVHCSYGARGSG